MTDEQDSRERLGKLRELWLNFICELGSSTGETEANVKEIDKILGLTESDHERWNEEAYGEKEREAEDRDRDKR
jgi:hypothetical protein